MLAQLTSDALADARAEDRSAARRDLIKLTDEYAKSNVIRRCDA